MPNRLARETSPYLRQHQDNPVDWYAWGAEAFALAKATDRPILLSVGYAACHWCHVMAHESFEHEATAAVMNELFVNVKVDREERPDVDGIYMQAVQAMTGHGGWPMTVFLTPDGEPFYAGTYFPPEDRHGMPSFERIMRSVADAYRNKQAAVGSTARAMRDIYAAATDRATPSGDLTPALLERADRGLERNYDETWGGFGKAPKFPQAMALEFLLTRWARTGHERALAMALDSFRHMARGGIYDQLGGGFARYAVDAHWLVPHFEKMLYDNALLLSLGTRLWQATGDAEVRRVCEETLDWLDREMTSEEGGFYASLDADSEGHEGKFYVWSEAEIDAALRADAAVARAYWGVSAGGNFEGANILHVPAPPGVVATRLGITEAQLTDAIARARRTLLAVRERRVRPGRDEKALAAWNGLALAAVAQAARVFGRERDHALALASGRFLVEQLVRPGGRVLRTRTSGESRIAGYLDDHAAVALGFLALYELTFDGAWLARARELAAACIEWFWDDSAQAFFDTARDAEPLITRPRDATDNAVPSGTSLAAELLLRLAAVTGDDDLRKRGAWVLATLAEPMARHPQAFGRALTAADLAVHGAVELALVWPASAGADAIAPLATVASERFIPSLVIAGGPEGAADAPALLAGRPSLGNAATAYVCRHFACESPTTDAEVLRGQLAAAGRE